MARLRTNLPGEDSGIVHQLTLARPKIVGAPILRVRKGSTGHACRTCWAFTASLSSIAAGCFTFRARIKPSPSTTVFTTPEAHPDDSSTTNFVDPPGPSNPLALREMAQITSAEASILVHSTMANHRF